MAFLLMFRAEVRRSACDRACALTVLERPFLDGGRGRALPARRLGSDPDVVDGVGRQVLEQVRVAGR